MSQDVKTLMKAIRQCSLFQQVIPIEAVSGWPALQRKGNNVYITVPYYIVKKLEKGQTIIYSPLAVITMECSTHKIVEYYNTQFKEQFKSYEYGKPVGTFPHEEIAKLTVKEYKEIKTKIFDLYNIFLDSLLNGTKLNPEAEKEFSKHMNLLLEPSLRNFYLILAPKFFEYFLNQ